MATKENLPESTPKSEAAAREERILAFWKEKNIFQKTLEKPSPKGEFIFYEGPPTANGRPGIHHLEARAFKDVIPRYKTMSGYHVRRKGGWDTHGLPVELEVEKQLGITSKKEIEEYGIAAFNKKCKESVWKYVDEWRRFTDRMAYWVDIDNAYITYDSRYIESVWSIVAKIHKDGRLFKDYKVVPWCPRCGTALSSHELAQGYQDDTDTSVYVKFRIKDPKLIGLSGDVYLVAWTTTPWTLPGNVALAVREDIDYVVWTQQSAQGKKEVCIGAKKFIASRKNAAEFNVLQEKKGEELVGISYEPLFPFIEDTISETEKPNLANAYKVYAADFVTTEEGTGIVHTAVMYGADDFELGTRVHLPKHHLVTEQGTFISGTAFLEGKFVKAPETEHSIINDLSSRELLYATEPYTHSYPHCWRCKTPLIYYANDSWFFRMTDLREALISENNKIHWEPAHIREGRFGEWLSGVKDWAISRKRYWGTPLPVWKSDDGTEAVVVDSVHTLKDRVKKSGNRYFIMRHGHATHLEQGIFSANMDISYSLTDNGRTEVRRAAESLKKMGITKIYSSPFTRCVETSEEIAHIIGIPKESIVVDSRLGELGFGEFSEQPSAEYTAWEDATPDSFTDTPKNGESKKDAKRRFGSFLYEVENALSDQNILIVTHAYGHKAMSMVAEGADDTRSKAIARMKGLDPAEIVPLSFVPLPHNEDYELDLHRPYVDDVVLIGDSGKELRRVSDVMDVWLDSGAMPFAQDHYPFENKPWVDGPGYPADYISEAIDQTRGWFYTLHAVGILMNRGRAFNNVICLGHLLDAKGKKMSKSVGNVVNPWDMIEKYGIDALRLWMFSINASGESKNFDEKTVDEIVKKVFNLLLNSVKFYELYTPRSVVAMDPFKSAHVLDRWIIARLHKLLLDTTKDLDAYRVLEAARAIREFVADLSQWYIRRSRDRFKAEDEQASYAVATTRYVFRTLAQIMAPMTPFIAEEIYLKFKEASDPESVHLTQWPQVSSYDHVLLHDMQNTREVASMALEARARLGIKVRQPLQRITLKNGMVGSRPDLIAIIADEVNVKEVVCDPTLEEEVVLDSTITPELLDEGVLRDIIRAIQQSRKNAGLLPGVPVKLLIDSNDHRIKDFFEQYKEEFAKATSVIEMVFVPVSAEPIDFFGTPLRLEIVSQ